MFCKLLKHEWKQSAGLLSILSAGALGAGLLGAFILKGIVYMAERQSGADTAMLHVSSLSSALTFILFALVAYGFAVQFINLFRFYKSKFTDEGYLTFTLPVTAHQLFLSSFLNILAWLVISVLVLAAAVSMIVFLGAAVPLKEHNWEIRVMLESILGIWEEETANAPGYHAYQVLNIIANLIKPLYSVMLLMTSIVIGCVLAKKHKILATIGMYYCISFGVSIAESMLDVVPAFLMLDSYADPGFVYTNASMVISILLQLGLGIGGYFLSVHMMKHKLNLP